SPVTPSSPAAPNERAVAVPATRRRLPPSGSAPAARSAPAAQPAPARAEPATDPSAPCAVAPPRGRARTRAGPQAERTPCLPAPGHERSRVSRGCSSSSTVTSRTSPGGHFGDWPRAGSATTPGCAPFAGAPEHVEEREAVGELAAERHRGLDNARPGDGTFSAPRTSPHVVTAVTATGRSGLCPQPDSLQAGHGMNQGSPQAHEFEARISRGIVFDAHGGP